MIGASLPACLPATDEIVIGASLPACLPLTRFCGSVEATLRRWNPPTGADCLVSNVTIRCLWHTEMPCSCSWPRHFDHSFHSARQEKAESFSCCVL